jgi:hypothetical protein
MIVLAGGSGLLGTQVTHLLTASGFRPPQATPLERQW